MGFSLRNLSLMTRLSLTGIVSFITMAILTFVSVSETNELLYQDRRVKTRQVVELAYLVIEAHYRELKAGNLTEEEAKTQAKREVKNLRYEKVEYFWIHDIGKPFPTMIMHPTVPALEGKVLDEERFNRAIAYRTDASGGAIKVDHKNLFATMNEVVDKAGEGFVTYLWPKPKQGGGVTEELFKKESYVKRFEPWGWVVGSGIYIDDLDRLFWSHVAKSLVIAGIGTFVILLVAYLIRKSILEDFGGEPRFAMDIAERIAEGNLTGTIKLRPGDTGSLLAVLLHMQNNLRDMLQAVVQKSNAVQQNVGTLATQSQQVSKATGQQAATVDEARGDIQGLSQSVSVVNNLAGETEASSREVAQRSQEGAKVAEAVSAEMTMIAATMKQSSQEVAVLAERTREINKMADVIKEIADQTNLLALNAAIEAARAGEQGRGFAVVADEVRKLAERTTASTAEISQILQAIQGETQRAVNGLENATPVIESGVEKANLAAAALREIEQRALASLEKMKTLSDATNQQAQRIGTIVQRIDELNSSTALTENSIRQSEATASEIKHIASELFDMTGRFRIG